MHGFAAFREPAVVDFAGAEYFALVGPTGSGKSTVIDAMTFALYGSVPRWDDRRTVALGLAPTATRGTVRLIFEVGDSRYVAARELRRSAAGAVTVRSARLERLLDARDPDGDTEILAADGQVTGAVGELLGLPFDQFCTCVVLPQGDFAQFLHAKPAERQETLTRILGLGVYRTIAQRAGSEAAAARQRAETLAGELERYAADPSVDDAERRAEVLAELADRVSGALPGLAAAERATQEATAAAERLRSEAAALAGLRPPAGLPALAAEAEAAFAGVGSTRAAVAAAESADTAAREAVAAAPDPEPLRQARRDHAELARLRADQPALAAALESARADVEAARAATAAATDGLDAARTGEADTGAARDAVRAEDERLADERRRLAGVRVPAEVAELARDQAALARRLDAALHALAAAEQAADQARSDSGGATRALTAARDRRDELARADQAAALRADLVAGHDCPVCAQPVHTVPPAAGPSELPAAREALAAAQAEHDRLATAADTAAAAVGTARADAQRVDTARAQLDGRVAALDAELRAVRDPLVALGAPGPGADLAASWTALAGWAASAAEERARRSSALDRAGADAAYATAVRATRDAVEAVDRGRAAETDALRAEHDARGASGRADARTVELEWALAGAPTDAEAAARLDELAALRERAGAADGALRTARRALAEADAAAGRVAERLRAGRRELEAARDPLVALGAPALTTDGGLAAERAADELVDGWRALTEWAARTARDRETARPAADAAVAAARDAEARAERALVDDLAAHELRPTPGRPLAADAPVLVAAAVERARNAVDRLRERQADAQRLTKERDQAQDTHQVANTLARLLRSNEFPRWLVASALDTLVADASARLTELSGGQFELTHENGEFLVVDHADADARRPVKTLSGGETFQASLALALALSGQLSSLAAAGAARLDSIFLDEGFGTLDETNLDVVAATLENLAALGDRMVGVVTHVPALAERVPVRFMVSRDQRTSSITRENL
jgi:exonuclease SbcC